MNDVPDYISLPGIHRRMEIKKTEKIQIKQVNLEKKLGICLGPTPIYLVAAWLRNPSASASLPSYSF